MSPVVSLHFPSFPLHTFLFPFLALPSPVAGPAMLPSDVHQCCQEENKLCRAADGAQEDKTLSCTREQLLFELRRRKREASHWLEDRAAACRGSPVLSPSSRLTRKVPSRSAPSSCAPKWRYVLPRCDQSNESHPLYFMGGLECV